MAECVITAVGPDRPGLVDELTGALHGLGANIADSQMANLRGQFAVILLLEVPDQAAESLREQLPQTGSQIGLTLTVGSMPAGTGVMAAGVPYRLRTQAMDQPGIVHRITSVLHERGINIEQLQTHLQPASVSGTPLFRMELSMTVPTTVSINALRREMEALCDSLNCDVVLEPA